MDYFISLLFWNLNPLAWKQESACSYTEMRAQIRNVLASADF